MSKLILLLALCVVSTMAVPSVLNQQMHFKSILHRDDLSRCATIFKITIISSLQEHLPSLPVCTTECVEEMEALQEDLIAIATTTSANVKKLIETLAACDTIDCKIETIQELIGVFKQFKQDKDHIVALHFEALEAKFPEEIAEAREVIATIAALHKTAVEEFITCLKA